MYQKNGFDKDSLSSDRGFGFGHAGEFETAEALLSVDRFMFGHETREAQARKDVVAFVMSMSVDTHAGVGRQVTLTGFNNHSPAAVTLTGTMMLLADKGDVGLVVRGKLGEHNRGYAYLGNGVFQSDRAGEQVVAESLRDGASPGAELTWTIVPFGSQNRIGIDRDEDGILDGDE
jgi:hypothetical protein